MGIDPGSMMLMSMAVGAIGTATSAVGAEASAEGQQRQALATAQVNSYKAQVAENNAAIARQKGVMDIQAGEIAAVNQGLKTRAKVGSEKAQQGAAGIDVNSGSAADVRAGTEELGMLDSLTIRSNAAKKAWSDEVDAGSNEAQAQLDRMAGSNALVAGDMAAEGIRIGGAGSMLSQASTVGGNYARWQTGFGGSSIGGAGGHVGADAVDLA